VGPLYIHHPRRDDLIVVSWGSESGVSWSGVSGVGWSSGIGDWGRVGNEGLWSSDGEGGGVSWGSIGDWGSVGVGNLSWGSIGDWGSGDGNSGSWGSVLVSVRLGSWDNGLGNHWGSSVGGDWGSVLYQIRTEMIIVRITEIMKGKLGHCEIELVYLTVAP
jgi:hypothetical protein